MPLGGSEPLRREILPALLCFQSIVAFLYILDLADVVYFPTINRLTYTQVFDLGFNPYPDLLIASGFWVAYMLLRGWRKETLFCLIPYLFSSFSLGTSVSLNVIACSVMTIYKDGIREEAVKWVLWILTGFYSLVLIHWLILYPLGLDTGLTFFADLEIKLYHLGTYLTPFLAVILLSVWGLKLGLEKVWSVQWPIEVGKLHVNNRNILLFSLFVGFFSSIYPYLYNVNPNGSYIGIDANYYQVGLESVEENIFNIFTAIEGSRPFLFFALRVFQLLTLSSSVQAVKFFPVLLIPSLGYSTYYLVKKVSGNSIVSGWATFFSVTGIKVVVGFYSYFLSNLLGLILIQFSLGLLFNSMVTGKKVHIAISSILAILCLYTHPWTYDQYIIILVAFTGLLFISHYSGTAQSLNFNSLLIFFIINIFAELSKILVFKGISGSAAISSTFVNIFEFTNFWQDNITNFRIMFGGYLSNLIIIIIALFGVKKINNNYKQNYFTVFIIITLIGFIIGDATIKRRVFYNMPIEYLASLGLMWLSNKYTNQQKNIKGFILVYSLVYLFRSIANSIII